MKAARALLAAAAFAAAVAAGIFLAGEERSSAGPRSVPSPSLDRAAREKRSARGPHKKKEREKETDGTQAPNRFEADRVIRSKYELNGEQLEVDPD